MRVLITWGSKHGGTEDIGRIVAEVFEGRGFRVTADPCDAVPKLDAFDAVIIGGALYANRWPSNVRRFVRKNLPALRRVPVWLFSSGPLDDSADHHDIPATDQVAVLGERIGAKGHVTFGGRLSPDVKGFPASAMAKTMGGDWRNVPRIRAWAEEVADRLPKASPGPTVERPAGSWIRLIGHGLWGWALCSATMGLFMALTRPETAVVLHAFAAPLIFVGVAWLYFRAHGARDPLPTAVAWTLLVAALDLVVVAGLVQRSLEMFGSVVGTWLPLATIFLAVWTTGVVRSMAARPPPPLPPTPRTA